MFTNSSSELKNNSTKESLTYKDVSILSKFINEQGKILPRRITGLSSKEQKRVKLYFGDPQRELF